MKYLLAVDQGTSSTRALVFDSKGREVALSQQTITQYYPQNGWVEHCAEEIWQKTLAVVKDVVSKANLTTKQIVAMGLTNQRETTVLWHKETGQVLGRAIVWQDRRTANFCQQRQADKAVIQGKTGLILDSYFSATKISWALENYLGARELAKKGLLAFGTIDSFLIWRFSLGQSHTTDITNASRTMLFNINRCEWDEELLQYFGIPESMLPEVKPCDAQFAEMHSSYLGETIPITGVAGDQQAAAVGQACFSPGMTKITYGTGAFLFLNTGETRVHSKKNLLSTVAFQIGKRRCYGLEGSIFNAGTVVKWLRDNLEIIKDAAETEVIARALDNNGGVYLVPAFTGLGAPHWDAKVRASLVGLQLDTDRRHLIRAALESVAYQTREVLDAMISDSGRQLKDLRVDGGMVVNNWLLQFIANTCGLTVRKPVSIETTARGAAFLAGLGVGVFGSVKELEALWLESESYPPSDTDECMQPNYSKWQLAVKSCRTFI